MYKPQSLSRILSFGWLPFIIAFIVAIACNRQKDVPIVKPALPYGMLAGVANLNLMQSGAKNSPMYARLASSLDHSQVQVFRSRTEDVQVYVVKLKDRDQYYGVKLHGGIATTEVLFSRKMKDNQNGSIGLWKDNEAIIIDYEDGKRTIRAMTGPEYKIYFAKEYHGGSGFCQREAGETFAQCYNAESDEFCDSFVSCIAIATNPHIPVLISIACSCRAAD
ncbi:hypothetical protein EXU57_08160 [Segetibacter sp. 3557_3]|uniref:hypothetical protein n=1 Tax=Segetibacter sp. 3557_3 TaxID=2547429 RepID=UPI001058C156|nr:hypothetical protein [Segetibacter sp. 3557_3]TDH26775.1 hypothetical protein EXU57_08160 [Segetibacter sp. 3557_3]